MGVKLLVLNMVRHASSVGAMSSVVLRHASSNIFQAVSDSGGFRGGAQGARPPPPPFCGIFAKDL